MRLKSIQYPGIRSDACLPLYRIHPDWKTNMEPKNGGLEDDFPFQTGDFQVPC